MVLNVYVLYKRVLYEFVFFGFINPLSNDLQLKTVLTAVACVLISCFGFPSVCTDSFALVVHGKKDHLHACIPESYVMTLYNDAKLIQ